MKKMTTKAWKHRKAIMNRRLNEMARDLKKLHRCLKHL